MPNQTWTSFLLKNGFTLKNDAAPQLPIKQAGSSEQSSAQNSTLFDLSELGIASVKGDDAQSFLQGQLSNDITHLTTSLPQQLSAYCNPKGRILALFHVVKLDDGFGLIAPQIILDKTLPRLKMFVMRSAVKIEQDEDAVLLGLKTADATNSDPNAFDQTLLKPFECFEIKGDKTRQFILSNTLNAQSLWQRNNKLNFADSAQWRLEDIHKNLPQVFIQTHELLIPQSLNLDLVEGVDFKKGCYPGQEIIARVKYRGKPKTRMILVQHRDTARDATRETMDAELALKIGDPVFIEGRDSAAGMILNLANDATDADADADAGIGSGSSLSISIPVTHLNEGNIYADEAKNMPFLRCPLPYEITL